MFLNMCGPLSGSGLLTMDFVTKRGGVVSVVYKLSLKIMDNGSRMHNMKS